MNEVSDGAIACGTGVFGDTQLGFLVSSASRYALEIEFAPQVEVVQDTMNLGEVRVVRGETEHLLGGCRFVAQQPGARRGKLFGVETTIDFGRFARTGKIREVEQDFKQLPLLLTRSDDIDPEFRNYTAELVYEIQLYRKVFDDIDRSLENEPEAVAEPIRAQVIAEYGPSFNEFFDKKLKQLESLTAGYSKTEHERHGFYFRRQVWDLILRSAFLERTNLRPRGYAGDSAMMRWLYQRDYVGVRMFDRLMHRHPVEVAAAQAVRNRRTFIPQELASVRRSVHSAGHTGRVRFMSVACGPAWELRDLFASPDDADAYEGLLLDQDEEALGEAQAALDEARERLGRPVNVEFARDSVRTMLRTRDLTAQWGEFHFVYSMGLFDYLNTPVATAVLRKIYSLLRPGGELIVGNFHVDNPSKTYMDYWMDWALLYRDEAEMLELAARLPDAEADIVFEDTRSQMFLRVRRKA